MQYINSVGKKNQLRVTFVITVNLQQLLIGSVMIQNRLGGVGERRDVAQQKIPVDSVIECRFRLELHHVINLFGLVRTNIMKSRENKQLVQIELFFDGSVLDD